MEIHFRETELRESTSGLGGVLGPGQRSILQENISTISSCLHSITSLCFEKALIAFLVTHRYWVVDGVLYSSSQALLHHAGERVELVLLVDFKHAQELPALSQASPDLPLHHPRAAAAARPCHLHLLLLGV